MTNEDASWELFGIACQVSAGSVSDEEARGLIVEVLERLQAQRDDQFRRLLKSERAGHRATLDSLSKTARFSRSSAGRRADRAFKTAKTIERDLGLVEGS